MATENYSHFRRARFFYLLFINSYVLIDQISEPLTPDLRLDPVFVSALCWGATCASISAAADWLPITTALSEASSCFNTTLRPWPCNPGGAPHYIETLNAAFSRANKRRINLMPILCHDPGPYYYSPPETAPKHQVCAAADSLGGDADCRSCLDFPRILLSCFYCYSYYRRHLRFPFTLRFVPSLHLMKGSHAFVHIKTACSSGQLHVACILYG